MSRKLIYKKNSILGKGFTLIEVLVSIVILCIGIFAIISMLSSSVKGNSEARKLTRAVNLASSKLDLFLYNGSCSCNNYSGNNFNCTPELDTTTSAPNGTKKCTITISWQNFGKKNSIDISTLKNIKN